MGAEGSIPSAEERTGLMSEEIFDDGELLRLWTGRVEARGSTVLDFVLGTHRVTEEQVRQASRTTHIIQTRASLNPELQGLPVNVRVRDIRDSTSVDAASYAVLIKAFKANSTQRASVSLETVDDIRFFLSCSRREQIQLSMLPRWGDRLHASSILNIRRYEINELRWQKASPAERGERPVVPTILPSYVRTCLVGKANVPSYHVKWVEGQEELGWPGGKYLSSMAHRVKLPQDYKHVEAFKELTPANRLKVQSALTGKGLSSRVPQVDRLRSTAEHIQRLVQAQRSGGNFFSCLGKRSAEEDVMPQEGAQLMVSDEEEEVDEEDEDIPGVPTSGAGEPHAESEFFDASQRSPAEGKEGLILEA
jgi:hypothetical protein